MKPIHCAAVDLGATSGRVVVGTWRGKRLDVTEVHRFANQFRSLAGHAYWDLPYLWNEARTGLLKAKAQFPALASVGVDAWGVDHVLVDAKGRPVFPVHAYRDQRTARRSRQLGRNGIDEIYPLTGLPNYPYNTSLQLAETFGHYPALANVAKRCLFLAEYFNFLLCGRMVNEASICSHSQLLAANSLRWSDRAFAYFGVPRHLFGTPTPSPRKLGPVTGIEELRGTISVLAPAHDTACAFAAMPASPDGGDLYLSSGTWSLLGFESDTPILSPEALKATLSNERMGDGRFRPLRSCLGLWLLEQTLPSFAVRPSSNVDWKRLIAAAGAAPAPKQLIDVTDQTLLAPANMRAAIDAQLRQHGARPPKDLAGYVRLICDSLGHGHADSLRLLSKLSGREFKRILIVGGGSKNALLCQATANAAGLPVLSYELEGSAVGNIANQLIALGVVQDLADFRRDFAQQLKATVYEPSGRSNGRSVEQPKNHG